MAQVVYVLCAATAFVCALLLLRGYRRSRSLLLFWSFLCFVGLTVNNVLLYVDLVVVPSIDLSFWRHLVALMSLSLLVFGLIWNAMSVTGGPGRRGPGQSR